MKRENFKCLISIVVVTVLTLTIINQAESFRAREYLVSIATLGDLVIVGKLLEAEGKRDVQSGIAYTDVTVEVVQVIRNITKQDIKVGSTINFRSFGVEIDGHRRIIIHEATFSKEEIGNLIILSLERPSRELIANSRKGFDTIFDVFGGVWGKYTVKVKNETPMVLAFWHERRNEEIGLPLELVLQLMDMAIKVTKSPDKPVRYQKPEDIPEDVKTKTKRLVSLEESIRKMATDGLPEEVIIAMFRDELARVKQELGL